MAGRIDEHYYLAIQRFRNYITDATTWMMASSAWIPEFKTQLEKLPVYQTDPLNHQQLHEACEVCNKNGRTASFRLKLCDENRLTGNGYDKSKMETLDLHDDKNRSAKVYFIGRFCKDRTRVYHSLYHFEFNLIAELRKRIDQIQEEQQKNQSYSSGAETEDEHENPDKKTILSEEELIDLVIGEEVVDEDSDHPSFGYNGIFTANAFTKLCLIRQEAEKFVKSWGKNDD